MIDIIIEKKRKVQSPRNVFRIFIHFMYGNADGYENQDIYIDADKFYDDDYNEFNLIVEELINALDKAYKKDRTGRGGFEDLNEMFNEWYKDNTFKKFLEEFEESKETFEKYPELCFNFPSTDGWYHSITSIDISYIDENGFEYDTEIKKI